jgi:hypothetical protein
MQRSGALSTTVDVCFVEVEDDRDVHHSKVNSKLDFFRAVLVVKDNIRPCQTLDKHTCCADGYVLRRKKRFQDALEEDRGGRKERETIMIMLMLLVCLRSLEMRTDLLVAPTVEMLVGVTRRWQLDA